MKLFGKGGKFNIIDIIVALVLIVAIVFAVVHFVGKRRDQASEEKVQEIEEVSRPDFRFNVICEDVPADLARNIKESVSSKTVQIGEETADAARIYNNRKLIPAWITDCSAAPGKDETCMDLSFTVEACAKIHQGAYVVGMQEVRLGKEYILKTLMVEVSGVVTGMEAIGE